MAFNREYMPLGWNTVDNKLNIENENDFSKFPTFTKYKSLTDKKLLEITGNVKDVQYGSDKKINKIFLYSDGTNPSSKPEHWDLYFNKLKKLSVLLKK